MVLIDPRNYHRTVDIVRQVLTDNKWHVNDYGYEYLDSDVKDSLRSNYNITNLYIRTRPDLLAIRDGFNEETFLIEAKDLTNTAQKTGNLAVEALPWFIAKHLRKLNIHYLYAVENPDSNIYLVKPETRAFDKITTLHLPSLHKDFFEKQVLSGLKRAFPRTSFVLSTRQVKSNGSQDPYLLVPFSLITKYGRELNQFAKWGWKN